MTITLNFEDTVAELPETLAADIELEHLAEAALEADIAFKAAEIEKNSAKDALKKALEAHGRLNPDNKNVGVVRTIIKQTRRFDPTLAKKLLTPEEIAKYSDISGSKVKENVAPATYAMMQKDSGFSLEVKVID